MEEKPIEQSLIDYYYFMKSKEKIQITDMETI